jgi:hypothetical protein
MTKAGKTSGKTARHLAIFPSPSARIRLSGP